MAEFFLSQQPLQVSEAARCLLGVLALHPVPRLEASVRLRLGLLLSEHTLCVLEAKEHLEKAVRSRRVAIVHVLISRCLSLDAGGWDSH